MPTKSGIYWVTWADTNATNSSSVEDLSDAFKTNVKAFIKALETAGATVEVTATKRSDKRAYLFHWSWMISQGKAKASEASQMSGVDIQWDHGTEAASKQGAAEMVSGFGLAIPPTSVNPPSLTSNHIGANAIDMNITWTGTLKVKKKDSSDASVEFKTDVNTNTELHKVGESYGVKKLITDAPHWSFDGR
jgi:hypothetical protein